MPKNFSKLKENLPKDVQDRINIKANAEVKRLVAKTPADKLLYLKIKNR